MTTDIEPIDDHRRDWTLRHRPARARRRRALVLAGPLLLVGLGAACSSDSDTAADRVCEARAELRESFGEVNEALTAANFGDASDAMDSVREDFEALRVATEELSEAENVRLQPQIDALRVQVDEIGDVRDLAGLRSGIEAIRTSIEEIFTEISATLDCS